MNSAWTPENIAALATAITGVITALGVLYHSIVTRGIAKNANANAATANTRITNHTALRHAYNNPDKNN